MGNRKTFSGRNSAFSHNRRGTSIGSQPSSSPHHHSMSHSSPVRQPSKLARKNVWGNGGNRSHLNGSNDRSMPHFRIPGETGRVMGKENFHNLNSSPISLSFGSDGSSISSTNSDHSKCSNSGNNRKPVGRSSNPLRYKTELCRSYEESGECR